MVDYREDARWKVYIHIVPKAISGYDHDKYYVGITGKSRCEDRWGKNGSGYKEQFFYNAIKKYGWNNIEHEVVVENLTRDEACQMEISLINALESNNANYGYNLTNGGDGINGYVYSDEQRKIISDRYKGENNPYYNKKHSEEVKEKMRKNHYDCSGGNNPRARKIHQFDVDTQKYIATYDSSRTAGKEIGSADGMGSAAIHHTKFMGYLWGHDENITYVEGIPKLSWIYNKSELKNKKELYVFNSEKEFMKKYESAADAAKEYGCFRSQVSKSARERFYSSKFNVYFRYKYDVKESEMSTGSFIMLR